jgi:hypothetical protein
VAITLFIEQTRRTTERRLHIMRMLLATRHMPADAQYYMAINLIPAEFNDRPDVMKAWRKYHEQGRERVEPSQESDHQERVTAAQSGMIFSVMRSVGLTNLSEGDIETQAYLSRKFVERDKVYIDSMRALPEIAATIKKHSAPPQSFRS